MRKILGSICLFLLLTVFIMPVTASTYENQIDSYDVHIKVNEDNTYEIVETIRFYFNTDKHGIYRMIPLKNEVVRQDGTKAVTNAKVTDIYVSEQSTVSTTSSNGIRYKNLKIGNPNVTITGEKEYIIKYTYNLGKDKGKSYDEFYFNIIGPEWEDAIISGISFTIEMPKAFDGSKLGFSAGRVGTVGTKNVSYSVDDNIIKGTYSGDLHTGEALTVRLELPDGYFAGASSNINTVTLLALILPAVFLCISFLLWMIYGKSEKPVETVEFYPPKGFNSAEVGFMYKGKAGNTDIVSLVVYLANKGYLKIAESDEKTLFSSRKSFRLIKLKEYDENNTAEKLFFDGLFKAPLNSTFTVFKGRFNNILSSGEGSGYERSMVTESDLRDSFYVTLGEISKRMNRKENRYIIFEESALNKRWLIGLMIIFTFLLITVPPFMEMGLAGIFMLPFALIFPGVGFSIMVAMLFGKTPIFAKVFGLIWGSLFGGLPWLSLVWPALQEDSMYITAYIIGLVCIIPMVILLTLMKKRTEYGNEMLGKIGGFKRFLEYAEKPKLEALVMQNPAYFYDILPYTYVLGVSSKWIEKFETIIYEPPSWYEGSGAFHMATFGHFMDSTMTSATRAMSSSPSSDSSGGGGGGGGSSGGGSGGGGGGSW